MDKLPISVIVPHQKERSWFFRNYCLPSIESNNPAEIIIIDEPGTAPIKRNKGAALATQDFLFFCDDDISLSKNCLSTLYQALQQSGCGLAYSNYFLVSIPNRQTFTIMRGKEFSKSALWVRNFISTMSLLRKEFFVGFDVSLPILQDWDLWLGVTKLTRGVYVDDMLFIAYDVYTGGISSFTSWTTREEIESSIRKKHQGYLD